MNITNTPIQVKSLPTVVGEMGHNLQRGCVYFLIPFELLYFAVYFHLKGLPQLYNTLTVFSVAALWAFPIIVPTSCPPMRCVQNLAISIGTMKAFDLFARRKSLPKYTAGPSPPGYKLALFYVTEFRYESFTPNHVRAPKNVRNFSEPMQLAIHVLIFCILEAIPRRYDAVVALEIEYSIYIIWTSAQLLSRYKSSPALFGPLYAADSISGFWSETWHNVFAAPCISLAYSPLRRSLPKIGVPVTIARAAGALGAFFLMAIFHIYALIPILPYHALLRSGLFFVINGLGSVIDSIIWNHRKHWLRALIAWIFEIGVSTWAISGMDLPQGARWIDWLKLCSPCTECGLRAGR